MPIGELKSQIARLPEQPGVYLFLNRAGETIYVGKAQSLRDRVRSYLGAYGANPKTDALLAEAAGLEFIVTDSAVEALTLENHLIKQRAPRYNVDLRDDKNYPYLKLTTAEACPRVLVARRVERDGNVYAGPYLPASLARRTMELTHRLFGIRSCNEEITGKRGRPCLEYEIKRCLAPCVDTLCSTATYKQAVEHTRLFLDGRNEELEGRLTIAMTTAARAERFEEAAHLRDAVRTVEAIRHGRQKMATTALGDRDVFGLALGPAGAVVQIFQMRRGRVIERVELVTDRAEAAAGEGEVLQAALQQFYEVRDVPPDVHAAVEPVEVELLVSWLSGRAGRRVRLVVPKRGEKKSLVVLATRNAALAYRARFEESATRYQALEALRALLSLPSLPHRIEGFDISTIQGRDTVASMVVAEDGRMKRSEYRKFRIQGLGAGGEGRGAGGEGPDDVAAMREVVGRRYRKMLDQGGPFPDLILIDGGKGQLAAAYAALENLGLANLIAVGLAKREEVIHTRGRPDPITVPLDSQALHVLQRIRDEAHRFAVTYHRRSRTVRDLASELDQVPGVGARRRRALLTAFGSLSGVRRASRANLTAVVGRVTADAVLAWCDRGGPDRL